MQAMLVFHLPSGDPADAVLSAAGASSVPRPALRVAETISAWRFEARVRVFAGARRCVGWEKSVCGYEKVRVVL